MNSKNSISKVAGDWISQKRRELGISQEFLASQLLRSQSYWSKIEAGDRSISLDEFFEICQLLGVDPEEGAGEIYRIALQRLL